MSEFSEIYASKLELNDVVVLKSSWREESGGNQNEYTTDEIICVQGGRYYRMKIETEMGFGWAAGKIRHRIVEKTEICQDEFNKIKRDKTDKV